MDADVQKVTTGQSTSTVLLIDDEPDIRNLYAAFLETEYNVVTASNGAVPLDLIRDDIDIILSDRRMPGAGGDELLARLRSNDIDIPLILISATDPDDAPPCEAYLKKPVTGSELRDHVAKFTRHGTPSAAD